jgi:hypothetical protein
MVSNALYDYYESKYHQKFIEAANKYLYLTPNAVFDCLKSFKKQMEMLGYYDKEKEIFLNQLKNEYKQHNKVELQEIGDKVRQICDPNTADKLITMLFEKSLTCMMYDVFGMRYGVGLSTEEKAHEIETVIDGKWKVTLDISGFDNSHNDYVKQPWNRMISGVLDAFESRYNKWIDKNTVLQQFCKEKSLVRYTMRVNKKEVTYCTLDLGPRLASGSTYTTLLNTFIMVLCIDYAGHLLRDEKCTSTTSGDDALALFDEKFDKYQVTDSLYTVFGSKVTDFFNNLGIKLKYCLISKDIKDIVPCSLDTFKCEICGIKMVRHFFKYIKNTFITEKYQTHFAPYNIDIEDFEQLVYEGEMAWGRGLEFVEAVMSPLDHKLSIIDVANRIISKLRVRSEKKQKILSPLIDKYRRIESALCQDTDTTQLATTIMQLMTETTYEKKVKNKYCSSCSYYYNKFLNDKYGIDAEACLAFYRQKEDSFDMIGGKLVMRDSRYIPSLILERAKKFYEKEQSEINVKNNEEVLITLFRNNLRNYWIERIKTIPEDAFKNIDPKNLDGKIDRLTQEYREIATSKEDYFFLLFNKAPALLRLYYDIGNLTLEKPVKFEEIYNKKSTYEKIYLRKHVITLVQPKFKLPQLKISSKLRVKNKERVHKNFAMNHRDLTKLTEKMDQFFKEIPEKREEFCLGHWIDRNMDLPIPEIVETNDIIQNRKNLLSVTRFYQETRKPEYQLLMKKYEENKERILNSVNL